MWYFILVVGFIAITGGLWLTIGLSVMGVIVYVGIKYLIHKFFISQQTDRVREMKGKIFYSDDILTVLEYCNAQGQEVNKPIAMDFGRELINYIDYFSYWSHRSKKYDSIAIDNVNAYPAWLLDSFFVGKKKIFSHNLAK